MIDVRFEGIEAVARTLETWETNAIEALKNEMDMSLEHLLESAKGLSPKLKGDLEGSGAKTDLKEIPGKEISGQVGFHKVYAARRHEEIYTPGQITQGKPPVDGMIPGRKYLEQPLVKYAPRYIKEWADAIRKVTKEE